MYNVLRIGGVTFGMVLAFLGGLPQARAQYLLPNQRPAVSPYLNLLRTGSTPAINYYGIVRPDIYFRNNINTLDQDQQSLANQQQNLANYNALPATGQSGAARFMTQSRYFMTNGGRGGVGGGGRGGR